MGQDTELFALGGITLSAEEAEDLDGKLRDNPSDVDSRLKLLGYSFHRHFGDEAARRKWSEHALWFIENTPENDIVGSPLCQIDFGDPAFAQACEAWDRVLASPDQRPEVILNGAHFFTLSNPDRTRALLERGERVAPSRSTWARELGTNLFREVAVARQIEDQGREPALTPEQMKETTERALGHFLRALAAAASRCERLGMLPDCAKAALECGRFAEAVRYADETIAIAPECPDERHRPDFVHWAHIVRGHAALQADDLETAIHELAAAGMQGSSKSPVLRSFGPDLRLAQHLLDLGKTEAVLAYLDRCATFWNPKRIAKWRAEIERGGRPRMFTGFDPSEHTAGLTA